MDDDHYFYVRHETIYTNDSSNWMYFVDGLIGMAAASCVIGVTILKSRNVSGEENFTRETNPCILDSSLSYDFLGNIRDDDSCWIQCHGSR